MLQISKNILITGAAGYLGTSLIKYIQNNNGINRIVGTDISKPAESYHSFVFEKTDIRDKQKHKALIEKYNIDAISECYLNFITK